jgi:hypothetical protein
LTYELPIPKGFEAYQPQGTPVPQSVPVVPTPTVAPVSTTAVSTPGTAVTVTPNPKAAVRVGSAVGGNWKMKDNNLVWEVGTVSASEMKSLTVMLKIKEKDKADYPVVLKPVLKSVDRVISEAAPMTMLVTEPTPMPSPETSTPTPATTSTPVPKKTK